MTDVPTRWRLERGPGDAVRLCVDRTDENPARGYQMFVASRAEARAELPYLRRMAQSIGPREPAVLYDPTEYLENEFGLSKEEADQVRADAAARVACGDLPEVRRVVEDGDADVDIAASRRRDHTTRLK